jgi:methyl-accepting chemotaxis protein
MKNLIGNLRLAHKFWLIGLIATAMLAMPSALVVTSGIEKLRFAQAELTGIEPAHHALMLVQLTQQHRGLSAGFLSGTEALGPQRAEKQKQVDEALARTQGALAALGDAKLVEQAGHIAADWQQLAKDIGTGNLLGSRSFARHTALIDRQLAVIEDISHVSGIAMHREASGRFLQTGVLRHLPLLTESLGRLRDRGTVQLASGAATPQELTRLELNATAARGYRDDAGKVLELAVRSDAVLGQALAAPLTSAMAATEEALKLVDEKLVSAEALDHPSGEYFAAVTRVIDEQFVLIEAAFQGLDRMLREDVAAARNQLGMVAGGIALLALVALYVMWTVTRTTTASVGAALRLAEAVAAGDLRETVRAHGRDEIGRLVRALGAMNESLARVVSDVRRNAEGVATASTQIAQGNSDLSGRTEEQASALEETAASMEELGSTVRQNADNAMQGNQLALNASTVAARGGEVVSQVVDTMKGINDSSRKIADIISVIDGIAFQTNILALNAAVEAARAGEQGRGFAVVAAEVRSLAQRSAEAAKEIKGLITASTDRVAQGTALVDRAGETMQEVVASIKRVSDLMGEISIASSEQSAGVAQVSEAVGQMDQATQRNAALVEESAAAAQSLEEQAQQLVQSVAVFKLPPDHHDHHDRQSGQGVAEAARQEAPTAAPAALPTADGGWDGVERRSPNRAKNVTRPLFGKAESKAPPAAEPPTLTDEAAAPDADHAPVDLLLPDAGTTQKSS